jgi:hypothetical protein
MQAQKAFDSPRRKKRGAAADLRDRLNQGWPKGRTALPPKRESILTPLNATYKGRPRACSPRDGRHKNSPILEKREQATNRDHADLCHRCLSILVADLQLCACNLVASSLHAICLTFWRVIRRLTWMIATRTEPVYPQNCIRGQIAAPLIVRGTRRGYPGTLRVRETLVRR